MKTRNRAWNRYVAAAAIMTGSVFQIPSCRTLLTTVELCGTVLGNCEPGDFDLLFVTPGTLDAYSVDPFCTIPGGCADSAAARPDFSDPYGQLGPKARP